MDKRTKIKVMIVLYVITAAMTDYELSRSFYVSEYCCVIGLDRLGHTTTSLTGKRSLEVQSFTFLGK